MTRHPDPCGTFRRSLGDRVVLTGGPDHYFSTEGWWRPQLRAISVGRTGA